MKAKFLFLIVLLMTLSVAPMQAKAITGEPVATEIPVKNEVPANVKVMMDRLDEIKAMDKSNMSRAEKKALRKEVRNIKSSLAANNGGVYLSVGAIIIIILLLILLL